MHSLRSGTRSLRSFSRLGGPGLEPRGLQKLCELARELRALRLGLRERRLHRRELRLELVLAARHPELEVALLLRQLVDDALRGSDPAVEDRRARAVGRGQ